ncbi:hypothetical protein EAT49_11200 [Histidinibacterium lentulum]|uniref:Uncharacterized protein n=1 Tax=Histidinibacterium lentulum TaxID=2480588 RepID=A0A3N2R0T5_9RHOB|nr:hypothetical protein EAT49_11200 [Histidinibacterium lentulum]
MIGTGRRAEPREGNGREFQGPEHLSSPTLTLRQHTISSESRQIANPCRCGAAAPTGEREIGVPVIFVVTTLNTDGTWAHLQGRPVNPDGSPIDWSRTNVGREMAGDMMSDVAMVLTRKVGEGWGVVDQVFGPTDRHRVG